MLLAVCVWNATKMEKFHKYGSSYRFDQRFCESIYMPSGGLGVLKVQTVCNRRYYNYFLESLLKMKVYLLFSTTFVFLFLSVCLRGWGLCWGGSLCWLCFSRQVLCCMWSGFGAGLRLTDRSSSGQCITQEGEGKGAGMMLGDGEGESSMEKLILKENTERWFSRWWEANSPLANGN